MGLGYMQYNYGNRYNNFNGALSLSMPTLNFTNNQYYTVGYNRAISNLTPQFQYSPFTYGAASSTTNTTQTDNVRRRRNNNNTQEDAVQNQPKLDLNDYCLTELKEEEKVKEKKITNKNIGTLSAIGTGVLFSAGYLKRAFQTKKTSDVLKSVFTNSDGYAKLMASAPIEMIDAQDKMMKLAIKYNRLKGKDGKLTKLGMTVADLDKDYVLLKELMEEAVKSGDPKAIAAASAKISQATNSGMFSWFKWKGTANLTNSVDIKPQVGNGIKNFGGLFGIVMGSLSAITTFTTERKKWKEAEQYGEEYAKQQKKQGWARVISNFVSYVGMDGLTRMGLNALLKKGAKVLATKVLSAGASTVLKVAVGAIPFAGPFLSMAVGALTNLAIEKLIVQRMTKSGNDALVEAKVDAKTNEDYYLEICQKQQNGEELTEMEQTVWNNNEDYFAQVVLPQIEQAQLEQQQAALAAQQQAGVVNA